MSDSDGYTPERDMEVDLPGILTVKNMTILISENSEWLKQKMLELNQDFLCVAVPKL